MIISNADVAMICCDDMYRICVHEAGHFVTSVEQCVPLRGVLLSRERRVFSCQIDEEWYGHAYVGGRKSAPGWEEDAVRLMVVLNAGTLAEHLTFPKEENRGGDLEDLIMLYILSTMIFPGKHIYYDSFSSLPFDISFMKPALTEFDKQRIELLENTRSKAQSILAEPLNSRAVSVIADHLFARAQEVSEIHIKPADLLNIL